MTGMRVRCSLGAGAAAVLAGLLGGWSVGGALLIGAVTVAVVSAAPSFVAGVATGAFSRGAAASPRRVAAMTGLQFEEHVAHIARRSGLAVTMTPLSGDWGVDLIVGRRPHRLAVQCKRQSRPVGTAAVQQVVAGAPMQDCQSTMVVTNAAFTAAARRIAERHGTVLVCGDELHRLDRLLRAAAASTPGP